jgi:hypothetical protein
MISEFKRSTRCESAHCVEVAFVTSSYCEMGQCVEVGRHADGALVRDSKDPEGGVIGFGRTQWQAFLAAAKTGRWAA